MKSQYPMVYVEFLDHKSRSSWQDQDDLKSQRPVVCCAVGFLAQEEKDCYKVSTSQADDGDVGDTILIIKSTVTKFKKFKIR